MADAVQRMAQLVWLSRLSTARLSGCKLSFSSYFQLSQAITHR